MRVEQDGMGLGVISNKFYQVEGRGGLQGNARSPNPVLLARPRGDIALFGAFFSMKLDDSQRQMAFKSYEI